MRQHAAREIRAFSLIRCAQFVGPAHVLLNVNRSCEGRGTRRGCEGGQTPPAGSPSGHNAGLIRALIRSRSDQAFASGGRGRAGDPLPWAVAWSRGPAGQSTP